MTVKGNGILVGIRDVLVRPNEDKPTLQETFLLIWETSSADCFPKKKLCNGICDLLNLIGQYMDLVKYSTRLGISYKINF